MSRYILAIETSCDETAIAILENGVHIRANLVASQIAKHRPFGGVVPELASRCHTEVINPLIDKALKDASLTLQDLDAIAVTHGPGLVGALLVGMAAGKALSAALDIPLVAVNHLRSHVYSNFINNTASRHPSAGWDPDSFNAKGNVATSTVGDPSRSLPQAPTWGWDDDKFGFQFPYLILLVSGGHTQLISMQSHTQLEILAETTDDAAGEAFDKVARLLELGYPGGPAIQEAAKQGDPSKVKFNLSKAAGSFSFSGVKTGVAVYMKKHPDANKFDVAAGFQKVVVETLVHKTIEMALNLGHKQVLLCGGVAANQSLRQTLEQACQQHGLKFSVPAFEFCTDNAAMVGCAGYFQWQAMGASELSVLADPNLVLA